MSLEVSRDDINNYDSVSAYFENRIDEVIGREIDK